jgi:hypothetical protein
LFSLVFKGTSGNKKIVIASNSLIDNSRLEGDVKINNSKVINSNIQDCSNVVNSAVKYGTINGAYISDTEFSRSLAETKNLSQEQSENKCSFVDISALSVQNSDIIYDGSIEGGVHNSGLSSVVGKVVVARLFLRNSTVSVNSSNTVSELNFAGRPAGSDYNISESSININDGGVIMRGAPLIKNSSFSVNFSRLVMSNGVIMANSSLNHHSGDGQVGSLNMVDGSISGQLNYTGASKVISSTVQAGNGANARVGGVISAINGSSVIVDGPIFGITADKLTLRSKKVNSVVGINSNVSSSSFISSAIINSSQIVTGGAIKGSIINSQATIPFYYGTLSDLNNQTCSYSDNTLSCFDKEL